MVRSSLAQLLPLVEETGVGGAEVIDECLDRRGTYQVGNVDAEIRGATTNVSQQGQITMFHFVAVSEYVVFDLEANADQAHPPQHEIIEIGAVLIRDGEETDRLQTLARPARQLRPQTQELTGITQEMVSDAPPLAEALHSFRRFVGNRPLIAHNGFGYDFTLLDASNLPIPDGQRLDSLELAHVVFPRAGKGISSNVDDGIPPKGRSLDELARHFFGDQPRGHHRALDDARLLHRVLMRLLDAMEDDTPMRCLQRWILNAGDHPWASFLSPQSARTPLADVVPLPEPPQPRPPARQFRPDAVAEMFQAGGTLMGQAREPRKQQTEMAELIAHTLAQGGRRLIEAPTGTGKTLAYLTPAIAYGQAAQKPVVVAPQFEGAPRPGDDHFGRAPERHRSVYPRPAQGNGQLHQPGLTRRRIGHIGLG